MICSLNGILRGISVTTNSASAPDSFRQQTIGIAAAELHEEIQQRKQHCPDGTAAIGEQMDRFVVSRAHSEAYRPDRRHAFWLSSVLLCCSLTAPAQIITQRGDTG